MAKTQAEYIEEQNRAAQAETEKRWTQREEQDAAYIAANNSAVDQSTAAALKPYETRMEQLPEEYRKQYDYNAVEELVRQKQVAETMANLGLTDSGLNRTQQTAIAVSRGNADAAARLSQQEKTQELRDKMDQLKATGEIQKQQTAAEVKANSQAWYNNLQSAAYENAANRGTALYEAEQQRLADAAALQKQLEWQNQQAELWKAANSQVEAKPVIMPESEFMRQKREGNSTLKAYATYNDYVKAMERERAADEGVIVPKSTANTAEFIRNVTRNEFTNKSAGKKYNNDFDAYVKDTLARWYNNGRLDKNEFAFLMDYYGVGS